VSQEEQKRLVATAALSYIKDGIALGVGTGSTVDFLIDALPPYAAKLTAVVSSSERSTRRLEAAGIKVTRSARPASSISISTGPTRPQNTCI